MQQLHLISVFYPLILHQGLFRGYRKGIKHQDFQVSSITVTPATILQRWTANLSVYWGWLRG